MVHYEYDVEGEVPLSVLHIDIEGLFSGAESVEQIMGRCVLNSAVRATVAHHYHERIEWPYEQGKRYNEKKVRRAADVKVFVKKKLVVVTRKSLSVLADNGEDSSEVISGQLDAINIPEAVMTLNTSDGPREIQYGTEIPDPRSRQAYFGHTPIIDLVVAGTTDPFFMGYSDIGVGRGEKLALLTLEC